MTTTILTKSKPLTADELHKINAYWRAANYLSVGQIYLLGNPLLRERLKLEHIKPRLLGHWGTTPGLNFIYVHFNRLTKLHDLNVIYVAGPGHGGPGLVANNYLEGTYSEYYPNISQDEEGMKQLFKQFSFPGGIPSHVAPETPGSIHEGGELGYSLLHAYGAAFDNPDLLVCCVVGDGEAETASLATSWHSNKFLNPVHDGAVLPILHLNGYKIAGPTILARLSKEELEYLFLGYGYKPYFVEGSDPEIMHQLMAGALDTIIAEIKAIQKDARTNGFSRRPQWPMLILQTPKGWTGPKIVDNVQVEDTFRSHQVPLSEMPSNPEHLKLLEEWMKSYKPEELFDENGTLITELQELAPNGNLRIGANPHTNGGLLLKDLKMPDFRNYAVEVVKPGTVYAESTRVMGYFLRDVVKLNKKSRNFRVMGPDETNSNRLNALFEVTNRVSTAEILPIDDHISPDGRVMEVLSENMCQGWLEGYLLTGRHGLFSCYEASTSSLEGTRILQILVKQGDKVKTGQVLAVLDIRDRRLAALKEASEQVKVAQARLAQVKAGAKAGEINAQEATVSRLEAQMGGEVATQQATVARLKAQLRGEVATQQETISRLESQLRNAQTEYQRYEQLYRSGAISASNLDSKRLAVDTVRDQVNEAKAALNKIRETLQEQIKEAQETVNKTKATFPQQINEAKANLNRIAEVRPTDVQAAQAEVDKAAAAVAKAKADLEVAYVKASKDGRILKIHARPGETVSNQGDGILKLGQTDQMYAVAEVYETDISKVRLGQTATITSDAFPEKLQGKVDQIGWEVAKKDVLSTDPAAATDVRVVEVKIALDRTSSQRVAALTNMQVTVEIQP